MGDGGLGIAPNPQSPIPNPQSPIPKYIYIYIFMKYYNNKNNYNNKKNKKIKSPLIKI